MLLTLKINCNSNKFSNCSHNSGTTLIFLKDLTIAKSEITVINKIKSNWPSLKFQKRRRMKGLRVVTIVTRTSMKFQKINQIIIRI